MRDYGKVSPQFWVGKTGKSLRREGSLAQLVALYLITSPHANMLGLYYLPLSYIAHDTGLSSDEVQRGLQGCITSGFCLYDDATDMVWVLEMARFQIAETLRGRDLRIKAAQNEYDKSPANPFLPAFYERYGAAFCMHSPRSVDGDVTPFEGASKPLRSQEQEQEQNQDQNIEQDQGQHQEHEQSAKRDGFATLPSDGNPCINEEIRSIRPWTKSHPMKTLIPENFSISTSVRQWAEERQITHLDLHLEHFISTVRRNGYTYVDWDEALKVAIRKDWADLGKHPPVVAKTEPVSRLGKAGRATANNAQSWLEDSDARR